MLVLRVTASQLYGNGNARFIYHPRQGVPVGSLVVETTLGTYKPNDRVSPRFHARHRARPAWSKADSSKWSKFVVNMTLMYPEATNPAFALWAPVGNLKPRSHSSSVGSK